MKSFVCFAALVVVAYAALPDDQTTVLRNEITDGKNEGEYSYTVELSDGTIRHEEARLVDIGQESQHLAVSGFFIFNTPDGQTFRTDYKSDVNGFQPTGAHIPEAL